MFKKLILIAAILNINSLFCSKEYDLHNAIAEGNTTQVKQLLEEVSPNAQYGFSPLHRAIKHRNPKMVALLIERDADLNPLDNLTVRGKRFTPLEYASDVGNFKIVQLLLDAGADPNYKKENQFRTSALYNATFRNQERIARALLAANADPNFGSNTLKQTPLMIAADYNYPRLVRLLLNAGADPTKKNYQGKTAFDIAKGKSHMKIIQMLKQARRSVTAPRP